jgi:competence protein ComEC
MIYLHKYPFVRLVIPYGTGIWLANKFQTDVPWMVLFAVVLAGMLSLFATAFWFRSYSLRWVYGFLLSVMLLAAGMMNIQSYNPQYKPDHFINDSTSSTHYFVARIAENPERKERTTKLLLELQAIADSSGMKAVKGMVLAYVNNENQTTLPSYGDMIVFSKRPETTVPPLNPAQFDFASFLARKGIFHQVFLKDGEWHITGKGYTNPLYIVAYLMRDHLLEVMKANGLEGDVLYVASAILLGYDDHLPPYLRKGYTAAGGMHVLCVSGLHVGVIFLIFSFMLKFLDSRKKTKYIKTIFLFVIIWFYALLTGLSPSVQRAAIMISFVLFGQLLMRKGYLINSLSASAFLLLCIDPYTLFHIGFQLSYGAVLGIVLLQKPVYNLFYFKNKIANTIWEITTVAIAAQAVTTPFVLHYFHQFPTYFMLSNLFLVPLSFVIIVSGMGLLLTSFLPFLPWVFGKFTSAMIFIMNYLILWIEQLPYAVFRELYITRTESLILIVSLILIIQLFNHGIRNYLLPLFITLILFFSSVTFRNVQQFQQAKMVVYGLNRYTAIDFIYGKEHIMLADSNLMKDEFALGFNLEKYWSQSGISSKPLWFGKDDILNHSHIKKEGRVISFNGKTIALWEKDSRKKIVPPKKLKVDYVLITGNVPERMQELLLYYEFDQLVLDLSLPVWNAEKWKAEASASNVNLYDIRQSGALIVNF